MNARERFLEIGRRNRKVRSMKWEFGYWGATVDSWYAQGLPVRQYPRLPNRNDEGRTPTSHLYMDAWNSVRSGKLPSGIAIMAGGLYWPTQGFPVDHDVRAHFGMDPTQRLVNVNLLFCPEFTPEIVRESDEKLEYVDVDGVRRLFLKETATIPTAIGYPVKDRASWERIKEERFNVRNIRQRFPSNWDALVKEYRARDYPLALGGYPHGFFGTLVHLMGYEDVFVKYLLEPDLIHDIVSTLTDVWIAIYEEVLSFTDIDHVQIWEDISAGTGSMVSPDIIREFMIPYYRKFTSFLRGKGVDLIFVDTDGDCFDLIPLFLEGGMTGMYPMEASCGMDIVKVRKHFPDLVMMGGIQKSELVHGKRRIDEILQPVEAVLGTGGYIPFCDHFIPPDVDFANFSYYRRRLNQLIDAAGEG
jgi:uroporphyrinogen decarboxylase